MAESPSVPEAQSPVSPKRPHPGHGFLVVVAVVLFLVLLLLVPTYGLTPALKRVQVGSTAIVTITSVNIAFTGTSHCWTSATASGGTRSGGQQFTVTFLLSYGSKSAKQSSCTVASLSVATLGFSLVKSNVPLTVNSGSSRTLTITVTVPARSYRGVLTFDATDTSAIRTHLPGL